MTFQTTNLLNPAVTGKAAQEARSLSDDDCDNSAFNFDKALQYQTAQQTRAEGEEHFINIAWPNLVQNKNRLSSGELKLFREADKKIINHKPLDLNTINSLFAANERFFKEENELIYPELILDRLQTLREYLTPIEQAAVDNTTVDSLRKPETQLALEKIYNDNSENLCSIWSLSYVRLGQLARLASNQDQLGVDEMKLLKQAKDKPIIVREEEFGKKLQAVSDKLQTNKIVQLRNIVSSINEELSSDENYNGISVSEVRSAIAHVNENPNLLPQYEELFRRAQEAISNKQGANDQELKEAYGTLSPAGTFPPPPKCK
jgi:hypothetical protein